MKIIKDIVRGERDPLKLASIATSVPGDGSGDRQRALWQLAEGASVRLEASVADVRVLPAAVACV